VVGGQSSRMGSDKALLPYSGLTLLERTLANLRQVCERVLICGPGERYSRFGEVLEDMEPGRGPLSGIQAALHATRTPLNLIVSVDMPLMHAEFLRWLLQQAKAGEQKITAPQALGNLQPLCAVYHRDVCMVVDDALARKAYKVTGLFQRTVTRVILEEEIRAAGFDARIFMNVNTPEDFQTLSPHDVMQSATGKKRDG
jgi:molybdenum cofactor guanylyltransferase